MRVGWFCPQTTWVSQLRDAQEKYKASVSPLNRPPKLSRDDDVSLSGSAELDIGTTAMVAPPCGDPCRRLSVSTTMRQAWLSRVSSDQLHTSTESIASRETRITHIGSDESLNGHGNNNNNSSSDTRPADANGQYCRLADSGDDDKRSAAYADALVAPRSGSQTSLPAEEAKTDVLSPHAKRLSRLKAIREKSQSLDAIYI